MVMSRVIRGWGAALVRRAVAQMLSGVSRSIAFARQDDSAVLIDQWVDQDPFEEDVVEQLAQVWWCGLVEAVAALEEINDPGEVPTDFGGVGLVNGRLALNLDQIGDELGLFLREQAKRHGDFVVGVHQAAALVFDVGAPHGQGAHRPVPRPFGLGQLVVETVLDLCSVLCTELDGLVEVAHPVFDNVNQHRCEGAGDSGGRRRSRGR